jgi:hypothetical protein
MTLLLVSRELVPLRRRSHGRECKLWLEQHRHVTADVS